MPVCTAASAGDDQPGDDAGPGTSEGTAASGGEDADAPPDPAVVAEVGGHIEQIRAAANAAAIVLPGGGNLRAALAGMDEIYEQAAQARRTLKAAAGGKKAPAARPGGLRERVLGHLRDQPDGSFTPHEIHKVPACGCRKVCHPMRPGRIRGSGRRAGPAAAPGYSCLELVDARVRQAGSAPVPVRPVAVIETAVVAQDQPQVPLAGDCQQCGAGTPTVAGPGRRATAAQCAGRQSGEADESDCGAPAWPARPDRLVGPGQPRCPDLTLENGDLVTQDEDLSILGEVGPASRASQPNTRNTAK